MTQAETTGSRLVLIDLARVLAIVLMIQGHAQDVLLAAPHRQGLLYDSGLFVRGLTAPLFLLLSGASFVLASSRRWDAYLGFSSALLRRLRKLLFLVALGYAMHLPVRYFSQFRHLDPEQWRSWLQVDVLQCIGVSLIGLQVLLMLTRTPERLAVAAGGVAAGVVAVSPLAWSVDWTAHLPLSVASYLNAGTGSLFPLLPWSAYVFLGAALGCVYLRRRASGRAVPFGLLAAGGLAVVVLGMAVSGAALAIDGSPVDWKAHPALFLIRAGSVAVLLALLASLLSRVRIPERPIRALSEESLLLYFVHVCLLYGSIWNPGFRQWVGPVLAPLPMLAWILVFVGSMLALGWLWNWYKATEPQRSFALRSSVLILAVAYGVF